LADNFLIQVLLTDKSALRVLTDSAMTAAARVKAAIIQPMVQDVPSLSKASSIDEIMPLPY
jgi:hypothetical protein